MAVSSTDIKLFKSANGDSAGGTASAVEIAGTGKNNLWPDLSDVERSADGVRYRKVFVGNDHMTDSLVAPKLWHAPDVPGFVPTSIGVGFDDADDDNAVMGDLTEMSGNAQIELVSDAADARNAMLIGIDSATSEPVLENISLTGTAPVLSATTFSRLFAVYLDSENANTVTIHEGLGGTQIGVIEPNNSVNFLWVMATSEATALWLPDVIAGARQGIWIKQEWAAGVLPQRPATPRLRLKEGV